MPINKVDVESEHLLGIQLAYRLCHINSRDRTFLVAGRAANHCKAQSKILLKHNKSKAIAKRRPTEILNIAPRRAETQYTNIGMKPSE